MGPITINDHVNGYYISDGFDTKDNPASLSNTFRRYRANVLSAIEKLDFRAKIHFIKYKIELSEHFLKKNEKIYEAYKSGELFTNTEFEFDFGTDIDLLWASFLLFLQNLIREYQFIYTDNFNTIKWLKDIPSFENLYNVLMRYNIINVEYFEFTAFWQMKDKTTIQFNSTIFETSVLFLKLNENGFMSHLTLDDMLDKELIYVKHGRNKSIRSLDFATYQRTINQYKNNAETKVFDHEFKPVLEELKLQ
jgi:hypothetical protein